MKSLTNRGQLTTNGSSPSMMFRSPRPRIGHHDSDQPRHGGAVGSGTTLTYVRRPPSLKPSFRATRNEATLSSPVLQTGTRLDRWIAAATRPAQAVATPRPRRGPAVTTARSAYRAEIAHVEPTATSSRSITAPATIPAWSSRSNVPNPRQASRISTEAAVSRSRSSRVT
jgi:hypothetical protein